MDKRLLIRNIKNEAAPIEREEVVCWIDKSSENEAYYMNLMNTVIQERVSRESLNEELIAPEVKQKILLEIKKRMVADKGASEPKKITRQLDRGSNVWKWTSCAAAILLIASVMTNIYQFEKEEIVVAQVIKVPAVSNLASTYYTENGVKGRIMLPDSSIVLLNSGSKITYPEHFDSDIRRVSFEGEGYFDVIKNPKWPMEVVTSKGMKIVVMGTKFHVKSYDNDEEEQATLFSGRIDISKVDGMEHTVIAKVLRPRESLRFTPQGAAVLTPASDTTKKVAWRHGELLFEQTPMLEVIKMLERWHGVEVIVEDPAVLSYKFTASFTSESIIQIMELFRFTSPLDYSIEGYKVYLKRRKI